MEFHYFIISLIVVFGVLYGLDKSKLNNNIYTYIILILLFLFAALRDVTVGNDTYEYVRQFNHLRGINDIIYNFSISRYEVGYVFFGTIIKTFTNNYTILLSISSAIYLISVGRFINKYSENKWMSIIMFYLLGNYFLIFNLIRQCIVISILLYSIDFILEANKKKFIISIIVASTFHISALVLLPLIFISEYKLNSKLYIKLTILLVVLLLAFDKFMTIITSVIPAYKSYFEESVYSVGGIRLATIVNIIVTILIILICKVSAKLKKSSNNLYKDIITKDKELSLFEFMAVLNVIVLLLSMKFNLLDRIGEYFSSILIVYIPNTISKLGKYTYLVSYTLIFLLIIYRTVELYIRPEWSGILPFRFR